MTRHQAQPRCIAANRNQPSGDRPKNLERKPPGAIAPGGLRFPEDEFSGVY